MVGTEAALHRVARADVVAFLDIDQHLLAARFGAGEEALALLARAARLVGVRDGGGRLLVQTRIPGHEVLQAAIHADPTLLSGPERNIRHDARTPPLRSPRPPQGSGSRRPIAGGLAAVEGITCRSPTPTVGWSGHPTTPTLCDGLASVPRPAERLRVEVDPTDA